MTSATPDSAFNVTVLWIAVAGATEYTVFYSTSSSLPVMNGTGVTAVNVGNVATTIINLPANAGQLTYFSVSASNASGASPNPTTAKSATPKGPPGAFPSAPTISYSATGQPILTWSPPATVGYSGALSYTVQDSSNGGVTWVNASTTATSPYTFTGRVAGVPYTSRVIARNTQSLTSTSSQVSGTPYTVPSAPQSVSAVLSTTSASEVIVSFRAPASNGFNAIQRYTVTPSAAPTAVQSFSDASANLVDDGQGNLSVVVAGLNLNTTYTFTVKAVNAAGSGTGATTSKKTNTLPGAPTAVVATATSATEASVSFNAPASNGGFAITSYSVTPYVGDVSGTPVTGSQSPISFEGLSTGTVYTFKVKALSLAGTGTFSAVSNKILVPIVLASPANLTYTQPSLASQTSYISSSVVYLTTAYSDVTVQQLGNGSVRVTGSNGIDELTNVNKIVFTDRNVFILDPAFGSANSSLASAVANARSVGSDGDIILLAPGSYIGSIEIAINKALTIQGPTSGEPAVIGSTVVGYTLNISCHNVTLNNITVDYSYQSPTATSGTYPLIVAYNTSQPPPGDSPTSTIQYINNFACNHVVFTNPFTKGTDPSGTLTASRRGATLNLVDNGTFDHCTFASTFNFGLGITACKNITVTRSTFNPCGWGAIGIFPSAQANAVAYTTSNINLSDASNVFNTMASITVQPLGSASATTLPTEAVILMQPNSGATGASDYPFTSGITGSPDVLLPSSMDYLYISDPSNAPASASTTYASQARYLPDHQYLESTISSANWYGRQLSTGNYLMEHRFNPIPFLNNIAAGVVQFQSEAGLLATLVDASMSTLAHGSSAVITADDVSGSSYVYNANVARAVAAAQPIAMPDTAFSLEEEESATIYIPAPYRNLFIVSNAVAAGTPANPVSVWTESSGNYTISSDQYKTSAGALPNVRSQQTWYVQSSADQDALLTADELAAKKKPSAPTIDSLTSGINTLTVAWTDVPGGSPTLQFNVTANGSTRNSVQSPYTITGLTNGQSYLVSVQSVNSYGDASSSQSGTPQGVPDAPSEEAQLPGDGSLRVFWSANSDNGSAITGYNVYWSHGDPLVLDGSATCLPTIDDKNNRYNYMITGLTNGVAYEWAVSAINALGEGAQSSLYSLATPAGVPSAPRNLSATPGNGQVYLLWDPPLSNNGAPVTSYRVSWRLTAQDGGSDLVIHTRESQTTSATITGLTSGSEYSFTVAALNSVDPSVESASVQAIPSGTPSAPLSLSGSATGTAGEVNLSWLAPATTNGSPVLYYNIYNLQYIAGGKGSVLVSVFDASTNATSITLTVQNGVAAIFGVAAVNANGEGYLSVPSISITPYQLVTLSLSNLNQTYTGSELQVSASSTPAGAPISLSYSGDRTNVGSYVVTASVTGAGYQGAIVEDTLVISKATATIDLTEVSQAFTGSALHPTVITHPMGLATRITYQGSNTNPGLCPFTVDISENNYTGQAQETLTITVAAQALNSTAAAMLAAATQSVAGSASALASFMQGITSTDYTQTAAAAAAGIAAIQAAKPTLAGVLLAAGTAINATKTNTNDPQAFANAAALVTALEEAYPAGDSTVISGADAAALLSNVTTDGGTLPTNMKMIVADSTRTIDMRDAADAYYLPMVPGVAYTIKVLGGTSVSPVVYSAIDKTISVGGTAYAVGSPVPLGFQSYRLYAVGTAGFAPSSAISLTGVTNVVSGTSAVVSWTVPTLGGITLASVRVTPTVNGTAQTPVSVSSGSSYTLTNQANGAVITFALAMVASDATVSSSVTSNSVTISSSSVPCFPKGTPILTPAGYKAVETLQQNELVLTADGRQVPLKLYGRLLPEASERSAPYFIPRGALGKNMPSTDLTLSPDHAFLLRKGVWMLPSKAATLSKKVLQLGVGEPVHYFHVECPNYLRDNLVVNGATVESYAGKQLDFVSPYTWSESLKGYTRMGDAKAATISKAAHA